MEIVFYISGIITALSLVAAFFYRSTYSSQQTTIKNLKRELISLRDLTLHRKSWMVISPNIATVLEMYFYG